MAVADVAAQLALWGYRVLAVDMDLEAPGLDEFFSAWSKRAKGAKGLLDLFAAFTKGQKDFEWRPMVREITLPGKTSGARPIVSLLSAGKRDDTYAHRVQAIDWNVLYDRGIGRVIERMRSEWVREFDVILVDSRTGVSDTGGICTIQLPDYLVVLFTASEQSVEGVRAVASRAQEQQAKLPLDRGRLLVVPVATRVDQTEYKLREEWQRRINQRLGVFVEQWAGSKTLIPELLRQLTVPYVPFWSYGERMPVLDESTKEKLGIRYAHENLAALLAGGLTGALDLAKNRDAFVREAQASPAARRDDHIDVFVSHDRSASKLVSAVVRELQERGLRVWYDRESAPGGEDWEKSLSGAIRDAETFVVLVGKQQNEWQEFELNEAVRAALVGEKRIIPVIPTGSSSMPVPSLLRQFKGVHVKPIEPARVIARRIAEIVQPASVRGQTGVGAGWGPPKMSKTKNVVKAVPSTGQRIAGGAHRRSGPRARPGKGR